MTTDELPMPSLTAKILASCCALLAAACERAPAELVLSGPTMGTTYTVKVVAPPASVDGARLRAIDRRRTRADRPIDVGLSQRFGSCALQRERVHAIGTTSPPTSRLSCKRRWISAKRPRAHSISQSRRWSRRGASVPAAQPQGVAGRRADRADRRDSRLSQVARAYRSAGAAQGRRGALRSISTASRPGSPSIDWRSGCPRSASRIS